MRCSAHKPPRRMKALVLGMWLAAAATAANAATPVPALLSPKDNAIVSFGDLDLMEAAFRAGVTLYESGDYAAAARTWQAPAERGHVSAQFSLGVSYATGKGVTASMERAANWWQAAAAQGHVGAQLNLGLLYWRGEGVEKNLTKARTWWERAASGGDAAAQFHLGALAATGEGEPRNYKEAMRWWRMSAAQGYSQAIKGIEILKSHGAADE